MTCLTHYIIKSKIKIETQILTKINDHIVLLIILLHN